jgi:hypothetical protein
MTDTRSNLAAVAADLRGGDPLPLYGERPKRGARGGNTVSRVRKEVLLGDAKPEPAAP